MNPMVGIVLFNNIKKMKAKQMAHNRHVCVLGPKDPRLPHVAGTT
jgi:hypothetical protein